MIFKGVEICCPNCHGDLEDRRQKQRTLICQSCQQSFPVVLEIPDLRIFSDPYIDIEQDRAKGLRVAEHFDEFDFPQLVNFYYSLTSVVPAQHARLYTRGLLAGAARAEAALNSWEGFLGNGQSSANSTLLEIGCGTAPLLVSAATRFKKAVGVDIAFRWLVLAKKRLKEAGVDPPLICACAEALPFRDATFDRVVADSTLEHVTDQPKVLSESLRVMRSGGYLFVSTPNRFSVGPDPQVGIWAGSILPERLLAAYVRRQGGIPPKRHLLSARELSSLLRRAGFVSTRVTLPDISSAQRAQFGASARLLIDAYQTAKRIPVSRETLRLIGPLLHAVAQKPTDHRAKPESGQQNSFAAAAGH